MSAGDRAVADWSARLQSQELTEGEARVVRDLLDALTTRSVLTDATFGNAMSVVQSRVRERVTEASDRYVTTSRDDFYSKRYHPLWLDVCDLRRENYGDSIDQCVALLSAARELAATARDQVRLAQEAAEEAASVIRGVRHRIHDMLGLGSPVEEDRA